jgi:CRISPR-associated exonuclease Cas4
MNDRFGDDELIPLSALQHYAFCPRQCALIHIEQEWSENRFTAEGRLQHDRVDRPEHETRDGVRVEYAVPLRSLRWGLVGKADVVEFHQSGAFPVEHKRGRPKPTHCDLVQLCAQALCLEEMLGGSVLRGAIFYGKPRRRLNVEFDRALREETQQAIASTRALLDSGRTPPPNFEAKKCDACSLKEVCLPANRSRVARYIEEALE